MSLEKREATTTGRMLFVTYPNMPVAYRYCLVLG